MPILKASAVTNRPHFTHEITIHTPQRTHAGIADVEIYDGDRLVARSSAYTIGAATRRALSQLADYLHEKHKET